MTIRFGSPICLRILTVKKFKEDMMGKKYFTTIIMLALAFVFSSTAIAQDAKPSDAPPREVQRPEMKQTRDPRTDFLHKLGLTEEQVQQIRKIHQEKKALMEEAQKRFREANRALNEAIYADQTNAEEVQARLSERQMAQAEVEKLRYMNEFAVRRVLTQEQLVRFRELRQRFEKMREELKMRRQFNVDRTRHHGKPQTAESSRSKDQQRQDL
ncbi:MAG: periplasmic heavy metal sensor [Chloracidobacterium sp.]|nr:periplasmic heavy metal sensor [Chloracidobacterium sp.]